MYNVCRVRIISNLILRKNKYYYYSTSALNVNDKKLQNYLHRLQTEFNEINNNCSSANVEAINSERLNFLQEIHSIRTSWEQCRKSLHELEDLISCR